MKKNHIRLIAGAAAITALSLQFTGCRHQQPPFAAGQTADVSYVCKTAAGEVVSSTEKEQIAALSMDPFSVFIAPSSGPVTLVAGDNPLPKTILEKDKIRDFKMILNQQVAKQMVGMTPGEARPLSLVAEDTPDLTPQERYLRLARKRVRLKKKSIPLSVFKNENDAGSSIPTVGMDLTRKSEPWLKGVVTAVDDAAVTVVYTARAGETVQTPYGTGVVSEMEDRYILDVTPVKGKLVRAGGFLAKISEFDENSLTLDFGNAFGGETLSCEVTANIPKENKTAPAEEKTPPAESTALPASPFPKAPADSVSSAAPSLSQAMSPDQANAGDIVSMEFSLFTQNGELVMTNRAADDGNSAIKKGEGYEAPKFFGSTEVILGKNEIAAFMEKALYGMKAGEKKNIRIAPEDAYGKKDPEKVKSFPRTRALPETIQISKEEFAKQFKAEPEVGKIIQIVPIFESEVSAVSGDQVSIRHRVENGKSIPSELGFTKIEIKDGKVLMTLSPMHGVEFTAGGEKGIIVASDDQTFTVDFNPPHAGESYTLDLNLRDLVKQGTYPAEISMGSELDATLKQSAAEHKPAVLVLYASWCPWCKRLFSETLPDPRVTMRADKFVWAKIDSDKEKDIYKLYEQGSFPAIVLLKEDGTVVKKMEGFKDAPTLARELQSLLN